MPQRSKTSSSSSSASSSASSSKPHPARAVIVLSALLIVLMALIQVASTFHTYALNRAELRALQNQEAALQAQRAELDNNIARWNDKAYVTAQARERLGFIFPGEQAIRVEHPEAVQPQRLPDAAMSPAMSVKAKLPWYEEMAYQLQKEDTVGVAHDKRDGAQPHTFKEYHD